MIGSCRLRGGVRCLRRLTAFNLKFNLCVILDFGRSDKLFFPTALHMLPLSTDAAREGARHAHACRQLSGEARALLDSCPAAPPWLQARWRALLSALLCERAEDPPPLCALAALCVLVTPQAHRTAALEGILAPSALTGALTSALTGALTGALTSSQGGAPLTRAALCAAASSLAGELLSALGGEQLSAEARAALSASLAL
jgi:hypothetical protein